MNDYVSTGWSLRCSDCGKWHGADNKFEFAAISDAHKACRAGYNWRDEIRFIHHAVICPICDYFTLPTFDYSRDPWGDADRTMVAHYMLDHPGVEVPDAING